MKKESYSLLLFKSSCKKTQKFPEHFLLIALAALKEQQRRKVKVFASYALICDAFFR